MRQTSFAIALLPLAVAVVLPLITLIDTDLHAASSQTAGTYAQFCRTNDQCLSGLCMPTAYYGGDGGMCGCVKDTDCEGWGIGNQVCKNSFCEPNLTTNVLATLELNVSCTVTNTKDPCIEQFPIPEYMGYVWCGHVSPENDTGTCQFVQQWTCMDSTVCPQSTSCAADGLCRIENDATAPDTQDESTEAQDAYDEALALWNNAQAAWTEAKSSFSEAKNDYSGAKARYADAKNTCNDDYAQTYTACEDEETATSKKTCRSVAKENRTACRSAAKAEMTAAKEQYANAKGTYAEAKVTVQSAKTAWSAAKKTYKDAQKD